MLTILFLRVLVFFVERVLVVFGVLFCSRRVQIPPPKKLSTRFVFVFFQVFFPGFLDVLSFFFFFQGFGATRGF